MSYGTDYPDGKKGYRKHRERRSSGLVTWDSIGSELLRDAVSAVSKSGGALRLGYTRDQGAYAIGVYGEGDPYTEYFHSVQDCTEFFLEIIGDYSDDGQQPVKTSPKGSK